MFPDALSAGDRPVIFPARAHTAHIGSNLGAKHRTRVLTLNHNDVNQHCGNCTLYKAFPCIAIVRSFAMKLPGNS